MADSNAHSMDSVAAFFSNFKYFSMVRKIVINWPDAVALVMGLRKSCTLRLRSGKSVEIKDKYSFYSFWFTKDAELELIKLHNADLKIGNGIVELNKFGRSVKMFYDSDRQLAESLHMLRENFLEEQYKDVDVYGKSVVDIGANVGDTALYFAIRGATHVYAFEPVPELYNMAKKNIDGNGLSSKITLVNKPCGSPKDKSVVALSDILDSYNLAEAVLKSDCEGAEYGIILDSSDDVLKKFRSMVIEFHKGPSNLEKRLSSLGFKIKKEVSPNPTIGVLLATLK